MQTLCLPAFQTGVLAVAPPILLASSPRHLSSPSRVPISLTSLKPNPLKSSQLHSHSSSTLSAALIRRATELPFIIKASSQVSASLNSSTEDSEKAKLAQVAKRLESTARHFKRLGGLGFWGQLVCTVVAAAIMSFSVVVTGKIASPATVYANAAGIAAAFVSVFWSFGYTRLSEKLRKTTNQPTKAPPRTDVVKSLKTGIVVNVLGMGAAILGMQATLGFLLLRLSPLPQILVVRESLLVTIRCLQLMYSWFRAIILIGVVAFSDIANRQKLFQFPGLLKLSC